MHHFTHGKNTESQGLTVAACGFRKLRLFGTRVIKVDLSKIYKPMAAVLVWSFELYLQVYPFLSSPVFLVKSSIGDIA